MYIIGKGYSNIVLSICKKSNLWIIIYFDRKNEYSILYKVHILIFAVISVITHNYLKYFENPALLMELFLTIHISLGKKRKKGKETHITFY